MKKKNSREIPIFFKKAGKVFLVFLFILVLTSVLRGVSRLLGSGEKVSQAESKLEEVKAEQARLKYELEHVASDFFQEKQARDKLGLAREGEKVVVLPPDDILRKLSPRRPEREALEPEKPNWQKWADLFFKFSEI